MGRRSCPDLETTRPRVTTRLRVLPEAEEELAEAAEWYESKRPGLGVELVAIVDRTFDEILDVPLASALWRDDRPYRRKALTRFSCFATRTTAMHPATKPTPAPTAAPTFAPGAPATVPPIAAPSTAPATVGKKIASMMRRSSGSLISPKHSFANSNPCLASSPKKASTICALTRVTGFSPFRARRTNSSAKSATVSIISSRSERRRS